MINRIGFSMEQSLGVEDEENRTYRIHACDKTAVDHTDSFPAGPFAGIPSKTPTKYLYAAHISNLTAQQELFPSIKGLLRPKRMINYENKTFRKPQWPAEFGLNSNPLLQPKRLWPTVAGPNIPLQFGYPVQPQFQENFLGSVYLPQNQQHGREPPPLNYEPLRSNVISYGQQYPFGQGKESVLRFDDCRLQMICSTNLLNGPLGWSPCYTRAVYWKKWQRLLRNFNTWYLLDTFCKSFQFFWFTSDTKRQNMIFNWRWSTCRFGNTR